MKHRKRTGSLIAVILSLLLFVLGCSGTEAGRGGIAGAEAGGEGITGADSGITEAGTEAGGAGEVPEGTLTVTFLDVGQGNAVLVEQDGRYMLIDGGDRDNSSFVVSYLKDQGVTELSYVVSSHYDADHLNGVVGALYAFSCDTVLAADYTTDTRVYDSFCSVVEEKDIALVYPAMGDTYTLGDAEFTIVCPDSYTYADENDNSIGIRLVYGENSFLICGDAGSGMEARMIESGFELDSDVYLASHHGSAGSSSLEFLQAVRPEAVVVSAGAGNAYGHPTDRVLTDVRNVGADLYRTDVQGTIVVTSDGSSLSWNVEPCTDYRSGDALAADVTEQTDGTSSTAGTAQINETLAADGTAQTNETPAADGAAQTDGTPVADENAENTYIMNLNTKKFHLPSCSSAADISTANRAEFTGLREDLIAAGYEPCKRCNP